MTAKHLHPAIQAFIASRKRVYVWEHELDTEENIRRQFIVWHSNGEPCTIAKWTQNCSGCSSSYEDVGHIPMIGAGCEECGYTGKRRMEWLAPLLSHQREELAAKLGVEPSELPSRFSEEAADAK